MNVVAAALQITGCGWPVAVPMVMQKGRPLLTSPSHLPEALDNLLQYKDHEEAGSYDELWKGKGGLFKTRYRDSTVRRVIVVK